MSNATPLRVTLLQAPKWFIHCPPYNVALLTGNLRAQGHTVFPKDYDVAFYHAVSEEDKALWNDENLSLWFDRAKVEELAARYPEFLDWCVADILADDPQVVGFSVKAGSKFFSLLLAQRLKAAAPAVFTIFGGPDMLFSPHLHLKGNRGVDAVCRQEADLSLPNFLAKFAAAGLRPQPEPGFLFCDADGNLVDAGDIKQIPDLNAVPFADYRDFDFTQYLHPQSFAMVWSRGCINRCSYCSEALTFKRYRSVSAQRIHQEITCIRDTSNVQRPLYLRLNDSLLNGDLNQLAELTKLLTAEPFPGLHFDGFLRARPDMSDELIHKLARAGLSTVFIGLETGSQAVSERMHKNISLVEAVRIVKTCAAAGIKVNLSFIFGHPGETEAEFHRSLDYIRRLAPFASVVFLNPLNLHYESLITRHPGRYGVELADRVRWTADQGQNTLEIREGRLKLAAALLGGKAQVFMDLGDTSEYYDPVAAALAARAG